MNEGLCNAIIRVARLSLRALLLHGLLVAASTAVAFPIAWMIVTSLKTHSQAVAGFPLLPPAIDWHNYTSAFASAPFGRYLLNSVMVAGSVSLLVILTSLGAGYAFGYMNFPGKRLVFAVYLATMMIPAEVTLIPNFLRVQQFGWYDTYKAMIFPWTADVFSIFMMRQFFCSLPRALIDAALIDGCSPACFLWYIAIPAARPVTATVGLFAFLASWNSLLWPLLVTSSDEIRPIEVGLQYLLKGESPDVPLLMAACSFTTFPILLLFLIAQRTLISGITTSLKE